jgi:UDP-3-O-[3-hydroxymyristoyl] glucosamine N-acyltransferase
MAGVTLGEIADYVVGRFGGDRDAVVTGVAPLADAREEQLSFLSNPKYASQLESSGAGAVLVPEGHEGESPRWIRVSNPYFQFARVMQRWFNERSVPEGISPLASIAATAKLGTNVGVGPFVTLAEGVTVGDGTKIFQGVSIEKGSVIGTGCVIHPNVTIYAGTIVGDRCVIQAGAVIGADGFGFATEAGVHHKIPQIGIVRIEDDVEIGANTTIDRATLGETVIGAGTKIDNLVQVAHNVKIGRGCFLVSQAGIAGSTELGDYVVLAGQSGVAGHVKLASGVQVGSKSAAMKDWSEKGTIAGIPARPLREHLRAEAALRRLPQLLERVAELEKKLEQLNTTGSGPAGD